MTLPTWTFADVMGSVNSFLDLDPVKGLVIAVVALVLAERIVHFLYRAIDRN